MRMLEILLKLIIFMVLPVLLFEFGMSDRALHQGLFRAVLAAGVMAITQLIIIFVWKVLMGDWELPEYVKKIMEKRRRI